MRRLLLPPLQPEELHPSRIRNGPIGSTTILINNPFGQGNFKNPSIIPFLTRNFNFTFFLRLGLYLRPPVIGSRSSSSPPLNYQQELQHLQHLQYFNNKSAAANESSSTSSSAAATNWPPHQRHYDHLSRHHSATLGAPQVSSSKGGGGGLLLPPPPPPAAAAALLHPYASGSLVTKRKRSDSLSEDDGNPLHHHRRPAPSSPSPYVNGNPILILLSDVIQLQ